MELQIFLAVRWSGKKGLVIQSTFSVTHVLCLQYQHKWRPWFPTLYHTYNQNIDSTKIELWTPLFTIIIINKIFMQYLENPQTKSAKMVNSALSNKISSLLKILKCLTLCHLWDTQKGAQHNLWTSLTSSLVRFPSYVLTILNCFNFLLQANSGSHLPPVHL